MIDANQDATRTLLEPPVRASGGTPPFQPWAGVRGRVLVVDDDVLVTDSLRVALERAAYIVGTAASAADALAETEDEKWDLALVDLVLPDMDGLELINELKARRPDMVTIVLTGHGSGANGFAAREAGAYAFLEKPGDMTPEKILMVTANALEYRQAGRELEAWRQQVTLSEKLATVGTLVSGVGHEIRTPLTYITYNLYLVRREIERARQRDPNLDEVAGRILEYEAAALDGVARISRLVEDLRSFTRRETQGRVEADLRDVVTVAVDLFRAIRGAPIAVEVDLTPVPGLLLEAGQIQQVVFNLLNNSAEAMPAGGTIRIATRRVSGGGEIVVADDGPGLTPEVRARLFQPFFTTKPGGNGLGLSICQRIIEAHDGHIRYTTRLDEGTTFMVFLPASPRAECQSSPAA